MKHGRLRITVFATALLCMAAATVPAYSQNAAEGAAPARREAKRSAVQKWEYADCVVWNAWVVAGKGVKAELVTDPIGGRQEIKGDKVRLVDYLNKMGQEGWELVSLSSMEHTGENWRAVEMLGVLKRPL